MTNVAPAPPTSPPLAELLAEARHAGLRLRVSAGGGLAIAGQPSPVLLARLRANKPALLDLLRASSRVPGATP